MSHWVLPWQVAWWDVKHGSYFLFVCLFCFIFMKRNSTWHQVTMWFKLYVMAWVLPEIYFEVGFEYLWFAWKMIPERTGKEVEMWDREKKEANVGTLMDGDSDQLTAVTFRRSCGTSSIRDEEAGALPLHFPCVVAWRLFPGVLTPLHSGFHVHRPTESSWGENHWECNTTPLAGTKMVSVGEI